MEGAASQAEGLAWGWVWGQHSVGLPGNPAHLLTLLSCLRVIFSVLVLCEQPKPSLPSWQVPAGPGQPAGTALLSLPPSHRLPACTGCLWEHLCPSPPP